MDKSDSEWTKAYSMVVARAWSDPAYKQRLLSDANAVLKEQGVVVPDGVVVKIVENTPTTVYLTLPTAPDFGESSVEELSDSALGAIAGGGGKWGSAYGF